MADAVYLDYNATAPLKPEVLDAVAVALRQTGNASSVHRFGRWARREVETARSRVADLVGVSPDHVIFTSGGTEANNLVFAGVARERTIVSAIEHDSVHGAAADAETIPVTRDGVVDLDVLAGLLTSDDRRALVSIMLANNETGVIQPVAEAAMLAHAAGALIHCDAVQAVGRIPVDVATLGVDFLALSAHKFGGPQGSGALVVKEDSPLRPMLRGGGQERNRRAGTENVAALVGFGAAALSARRDLDRQVELALLRDALEARIRAILPTAIVFGASARRLANTSCFSSPGVPSATQVMALDLAGVAVSAGSACSSGKIGPSHVLAAMGASPAEAECAIRVSLGWRSHRSDIDRFVDAWRGLIMRRAVAVDQPAA